MGAVSRAESVEAVTMRSEPVGVSPPLEAADAKSVMKVAGVKDVVIMEVDVLAQVVEQNLLSAKQQIWLQNALRELSIKDIPSALSCDNVSSIDLSHNPRISDRSKHNIAYHHIRELVNSGILTLLHIPGERNPADICTKALPGPRFSYLKG